MFRSAIVVSSLLSLVFHFPAPVSHPRVLNVFAKKIIGLARGGKYEPVADFCFTIPEGTKGRIVAQTIIDAPGHELVILNRTESEVLRALRAETVDAPDREQAICKKLIDAARVREPLIGGVPMEFRNNNPSLYEMDLSVDPNIDRQHVVAWITRCKNNSPVDAMYHLQFMNPGSFWQRHFSCEDQGLLPLYLLALLFCAVSGLAWFASWRAVERSAASPFSSLVAGSLSAVGLLSLSVLLYTLHLALYASDGIGLSVLKFLSQFFETCMRCLVFVLIASVATRSSPGGTAVSQQYHSLAVLAAAIYVFCQLVYNAAESQAYSSASAYALLRSFSGIPFLLGNVIAAGFVLLVCVNNALQTGDSASRRFQSNFAVGTLIYFALPVVLVLFTRGNPTRDTATMLLLEFTTCHILHHLLCRQTAFVAAPPGAKGLPTRLQQAHPYTGI
ncbi:hypothetical protein BESB_008130 [Besnoitia besnoiti]|uniref:GPR180/TMEM145 transmembrane domain-containing protein n=1 Tax=Besnoitia besnoiti TaxID=94643 RepID=A0A2A9MP94_BESBE|nr:hypothetical protein BESB_008130 [Besnoitia besnoiti]PFH38471.1 hypothetical protein BESB_008130 [Besnoitia besnoiti]